jgi:hypothetical protein
MCSLVSQTAKANTNNTVETKAVGNSHSVQEHVDSQTVVLNAEGKNNIKLNVSSKELVKGNSYTLRVYRSDSNHKISFRSSDKKVVSVNYEDGDKKCVIVGGKVGTATVTVVVKDGSGFLAKTVATLECKVTVGPPAYSIKFLQDNVTINAGDRVNLFGKLEIKPGNSTEVPSYVVEDSDIGTISASGYFLGKKQGQTTVTATLKNGLSATITIIVNEEQETLTK